MRTSSEYRSAARSRGLSVLASSGLVLTFCLSVASNSFQLLSLPVSCCHPSLSRVPRFPFVVFLPFSRKISIAKKKKNCSVPKTTAGKYGVRLGSRLPSFFLQNGHPSPPSRHSRNPVLFCLLHSSGLSNTAKPADNYYIPKTEATNLSTARCVSFSSLLPIHLVLCSSVVSTFVVFHLSNQGKTTEKLLNAQN